MTINDLIHDDDPTAPNEHALQFFDPKPKRVAITAHQRQLLQSATRPTRLPIQPPSRMAPTPPPAPPATAKKHPHLPLREQVQALYREYTTNGGNFRLYCQHYDLSESTVRRELAKLGIVQSSATQIQEPPPERVHQIHAYYMANKKSLTHIARQHLMGIDTLKAAFARHGLPVRAATGKRPQ